MGVGVYLGVRSSICEYPVRLDCCSLTTSSAACQLILWLAPGVSNEGGSSPLLGLVPPFLGPGFRLGARWNRLVETVQTRKK